MTNRLPAVIDTNVLVALIDDRDKWHSRAVAVRDAVLKAGTNIVYLDCVVNESISVMARRVEEKKQAGRFAPLLDSLFVSIKPDDITWISRESRRPFSQIVAICRGSDGALNFHDALIALASRELGIRHLLSFDEDFDDLSWLVRVGAPEEAAAIGS
ncbi:MAG: PIN domain-containing protein [Acidobacteriota bacterium]